MPNINVLTQAERDRMSLAKWRHATLTNDFLFNRVMKDKDMLLPALQRILSPKKVSEIVSVDSQYQIKETFDAKGFRFDIRAKDANGVTYDVEMQVANQHNLEKRAVAYMSGMFSTQLETGDPYQKLRPVYVIFLTAFDPFKKHQYFMNGKLTFHDRRGRAMRVSKLANILYVDITSDDPGMPQELRNLCQFMLDGTVAEKDDYILKLSQRQELAKKNAEWRLKFMQINYMLQDQEWAREQSRAEGIAEGEARGEARGLAKGKHEGKTEEREEMVTTVVESMTAQGKSKSEILTMLTSFMRLPRDIAEGYYNRIAGAH